MEARTDLKLHYDGLERPLVLSGRKRNSQQNHLLTLYLLSLKVLRRCFGDANFSDPSCQNAFTSAKQLEHMVALHSKL